MKRRQFARALAGLASASCSAALPAIGLTNTPDDTKGRVGSITDVPGIKVGHFTDHRRPTGCTAILFDDGATAAVDYDSSSPGSHEGVMLLPSSLADEINGLLLTGGGAFGLNAVAGVMRYLEEKKRGRTDKVANVWLPMVVGASIYDLRIGDPAIRPDQEDGYKACLVASTQPVEEGNVGAGAGATIGKILSGYGGMKGGLGSASLRLGEVVIGAIAVVNGMGDIIDWHTGKIIAGARNRRGNGFINIIQTMKKLGQRNEQAARWSADPLMQSTNLMVVATNASFRKPAMGKIAAMATTGAARVINPYHTTGDGDSTFAFSTNKVKTDLSISVVGSLAAEVVSEAVIRAIKSARSIVGWPAYRDYTID